MISTAAHSDFFFLHLVFVTYTKVLSSRTYKVITYVFISSITAKHSSHIYTSNSGWQSETKVWSSSESHCKCHYTEEKNKQTNQNNLSFLQKHAQSFALWFKVMPCEHSASIPHKHSYPGTVPGDAVSSIQLLFPLFPPFLSTVVVAQLLYFCFIFKAAYHIFTKGSIQNCNLKKFIT